MKKKNIICILIGTAVILLIPLVAMQFTDEVQWGFMDFIIIGILMVGAGLAYEWVASRVDPKYRVAIAMVFVLAVLLVWAELAVGVIEEIFTRAFGP